MTLLVPKAILNVPVVFNPGTGQKRFYCSTKIPADYVPGTPVPLVMVFHGRGGSGQGMEHATLLYQRADDRGAILNGTPTPGFTVTTKPGCIYAFPQSQNTSNTTKNWDTSDPTTNPASDINWIVTLIKFLRQWANISDVYFYGYSDGCPMCVYMNIYNPGISKGIILTDWNLPTSVSALMSSVNAQKVVMTHGTADPIIPEAGGASYSGQVVPSAEAAAQTLAGFNGCTNITSPNLSVITAYLKTIGPTTVNHFNWTGGTFDVDYYQCVGSGHTCPDGGQGSAAQLNGIALGPVCQFAVNPAVPVDGQNFNTIALSKMGIY